MCYWVVLLFSGSRDYVWDPLVQVGINEQGAWIIAVVALFLPRGNCWISQELHEWLDEVLYIRPVGRQAGRQTYFQVLFWSFHFWGCDFYSAMFGVWSVAILVLCRPLCLWEGAGRWLCWTGFCSGSFGLILCYDCSIFFVTAVFDSLALARTPSMFVETGCGTLGK